MANDDSPTQLIDSQSDSNPPQQDQKDDDQNADNLSSTSSDSDTDSDSDSDSDYDYDYTGSSAQDQDVTVPYIRPGDELPESENTAEKNIALFEEVVNSKSLKKAQEEEDRNYVYFEDLFDFPKDRENWREEDLKELWADAPLEMTKPGWDPVWADEEDWEIMKEEAKAGRDPPIAPFYLPYRKPYPAIPDNHYDIQNPKAVIEELDRIEEFLIWVSYIFPDGSSYEGTVWDDLAHGKGVYIAEMGLVRYEGEWLQNNMEGHGVVEVDIPDIEPVPGSKLEAKMRAEGKIIARDFMSPEDREWLEMDIEDSMRLTGGQYEKPFYENEEWVRQFGQKPEKGRYRYAGEWKHGRMHGCGVYEVNERTIYGRFYFGELVEEASDCDEDISALHAGIAEVAAAKARMFVNKPDGMVREEMGPYSDPQHPYFYEEEDVWMAPGFINQFYEVPDYWKRYVHEVDQEREMWLNSFYKAPLRLPMPSELEYWWEKDEPPEFILLNKEPEPDPEDPSKLVYTEDPLILHTPTGRIINYIEDEEHGIRLFWQPPLKEGEEPDPEKVQFLPLGYDEFFGTETEEKKESMWERLLTAVENVCKPIVDKLGKWIDEQKKISEMKIKLMEKELELVEAELQLEESIEDLDEEMKMREKLEEEGLEEKEDTSALSDQDKQPESPVAEDKQEQEEQEEKEEQEEEEEDEDEEEDDIEPSSFGSVAQDESSTKNNKKGNGSPFATSSLSLASCSLLSSVPSRVQSFLALKGDKFPRKSAPSIDKEDAKDLSGMVNSVSFPHMFCQKGSFRAKIPKNQKFQAANTSIRKIPRQYPLSRILSCRSTSANPKGRVKMQRTQSLAWLHAAPEKDSDIILSLHTQVCKLESHADTIMCEPLSL